jgi:hypothetical protein
LKEPLDDPDELAVPDEELPDGLAPPEELELLDELELPDGLELPDELELLDELELTEALASVLTPIVAAAGEPKLAPPWTLVSAKPKSLPLAPVRTGTITVFAPISPSPQLTVPLVAT